MSPLSRQSAQAFSDKQVESARRAYAGLLAQRGDGDETSARRLAKLIQELGKTPEQVEADTRSVRRIKQLAQQIQAGKGAAERAANARAEVQNYDAETKRFLDERREGYRAIFAEQERLEKIQVDASRSRNEVGRLMAAQPALCQAVAESFELGSVTETADANG